MADLDEFLEAYDDQLSPSVASISIDNGQATVPYYLLDKDDTDVLTACGQLLGYLGSASLPSQNPKIERFIPVAHPMFVFWYAEAITQIRGVGQMIRAQANSPIDAPSMPFFAKYANWRLDVRFGPRPYAVLKDDRITLGERTWYAPPPYTAGAPVYCQFAREWERFTNIEVYPQNDNVQGIQGQSIFQLGEPGFGPGFTAPHNASFQGMPRIFLPNQLVKFTWYQVPYRYVLSPNSYLEKYKGRVNQFSFFEFEGQDIFAPGSLLYLSYTPRIYTSPIAQTMGWSGSNTISAKYCDIELLFLVTRRTGIDVPTATTTVPLGNPNYIAAGHNLQPYFPHRQFYYTVFNDTLNATKAPYWFSFPVELLFTDPDFVQPTNPQP